MWIRKYDGTMENIDLSIYPHTKDKMSVLIRKLTNQMLYDYTSQQKETQRDLVRLLHR
jgi:hypothetical protein